MQRQFHNMDGYDWSDEKTSQGVALRWNDGRAIPAGAVVFGAIVTGPQGNEGIAGKEELMKMEV